MKILHTAETIKGGVATVLTQLLINDSDENIHCLIPFQQRSELNQVNCNKIFFKRERRGMIASFAFVCAFIKSIKQIKPDIIHLHSTFAGALGRLILILLFPVYRPKVVYCPHAFAFLINSSSLKKKIYIFIEKLLLVRTSIIICVSQFEKEQAIKQGFPENKLEVIYNGVQSPEDIDVKNPYDNSKINLLYIGRFDYQKGFDIILNLSNSMDHDRFKITAVGDFVNDTRCNLASYPVTLTGWLANSQIKPYLYYADAVIVPSRWEGFAMVPLEAMSYKTAVIAAKTTSLPEAVTDRQNGYLFDIDNFDALLSIVSSIDKENLSQMGINGYARYLSCFTGAEMRRKTENVYSRLFAK